ncbi:MAG: DNA alkylation repair protein [Candidatus Doudnabacteria bacterium RIFCSPHIGHO2_01_FULL_46_14]|uniref:DNA alkylation repair protein n=1 Tax=Candidatus Doudnabacteria bacterium RIFCSPHIGHO2_01_FULL_46_14 TaxID=1817824 RepID=A0A1F5NNS8_9BACT|nr:MAG: DNA alkylation repair protein [Candidatus Doudnabacteria bacterium RIFCSPHIGHO2_01_FULL_46_14]
MIKEIRKLSNPKRARISLGFFKTGKGHYGEGDLFLGLKVPECRNIAKKHISAGFTAIGKLLKSKFHEERLIALLILTYQFEKADQKGQKEIFNFFLANTKYVNNWDLVDLSSYKIVGQYLLDKNRRLLYKLANSKNLWERRIAIVSTYQFIRNHQFVDTLKISGLLLKDKHDLIHKAVGWMLREVGKRSQHILQKFLSKNANSMPRTALRYAIERFPEKQRLKYLKS